MLLCHMKSGVNKIHTEAIRLFLHNELRQNRISNTTKVKPFFKLTWISNGFSTYFKMSDRVLSCAVCSFLFLRRANWTASSGQSPPLRHSKKWQIFLLCFFFNCPFDRRISERITSNSKPSIFQYTILLNFPFILAYETDISHLHQQPALSRYMNTPGNALHHGTVSTSSSHCSRTSWREKRLERRKQEARWCKWYDKMRSGKLI